MARRGASSEEIVMNLERAAERNLVWGFVCGCNL
jgi:hypothetical protein